MLDILVISKPCFNVINREYYRRLRNLGYQLEIVAPKCLSFPSGVQEAHPPSENDPPLHFLELKGQNPRTQQFKGLKELIFTKKPKLIFLDNDPASILSVNIGRWAKKVDSKFICQSCENLSFTPISSYKRQGIKGLILSVFKNTCILLNKSNIDHVFTISDDGTRVFTDLKFKSVSKTPLGFNEQIFNDNQESRRKIREKLNLKEITISYFGRLTFEKGVHVLLKALAKIKDLPWHFIIDEFDLYATAYSQEIKKLIISLGLENRIIYFDANHFEVASYMNAADIVVLASVSTPKWKEQYGRVVPEGMACKNLLVTSNSGTIPELLGGTGLLFEENDEDELAEILREVILDFSKFQPLIDKAYNRAQQALGIDAQVRISNQVIKKLMEN